MPPSNAKLVRRVISVSLEAKYLSCVPLGPIARQGVPLVQRVPRAITALRVQRCQSNALPAPIAPSHRHSAQHALLDITAQQRPLHLLFAWPAPLAQLVPVNALIARQGITAQRVRLTPRNVIVGSTVQQGLQHARRVQLAHSVSRVLTTLLSALQGPIAAQAHQYALCARQVIFV